MADEDPLLADVYIDPRASNFPSFRPCVYHHIDKEIPLQKRHFVRKGYFGWYFHSFCLFYNFICMFGAIVKGLVLGSFFISLVIFLLGVPFSFFTYWLLYSAIRKTSAGLFLTWFCFFVIQLIGEAIFFLGISSTGGCGFIMMIDAFNDNILALGVMFAIATFAWAGVIVYNISYFFIAKKEYKLMGGNQMAQKEISRKTVETAYDNRDTIKQVVVDNKETIAQVAFENKDTLIDFAAEHKQEIAQEVIGTSGISGISGNNNNRASRVSVDYRDSIWKNQDTVSNVFDEHPVIESTDSIVPKGSSVIPPPPPSSSSASSIF